MSFRKFGSAPQQGVTEVEKTDEEITRTAARDVEFTDEDREALREENLGDQPTE